jgi:uncharacterized protein (TIGR03086 family)
MQLKEQLNASALEMARLIKGLDETQFSRPTPCVDYNVRQLVNHLLAWSPVIEAIGVGMPLAPGRPDERVDYLARDWRGRFLASLDRIRDSWQQDAPWEGTTELGFTQVPSVIIGEKTLLEYVVHGWDLAMATGQELACDPETAATALRVTLATAEESRQAGMFGTEVAVPRTASALDQALGASGRDPNWTPA